MSLLYPKFLWLLFPLIIYILFRKKTQSLAQNMLWGALGLLIVAISQPILKGSPSKIELPANSIVIGLDISASMRAEDISPNREEATRATILEFLKLNRRDQIALIGFTTNPLLLSPFTTDHELLASALQTLKVEYILTKGTDIKKLLQKVIKLSNGEPRLLILFSDGGDEVIDDSTTEILKGEDIEILTIAMATEFGASIPTQDGKLLKDSEGHIVVSKFNGELSKISKILEFQNPQTTAQAILEWVEERDSVRRNLIYPEYNHTELFYIPTLLALILIFLSSTRFITILALLGVNLEAYDIFDSYHLGVAYRSYRGGDYNQTLREIAKIESKSLESELILANSYYKLGNYKMAKRIYSSIRSRDPKIKQLLFYQLGNCEAKLAYYERAKGYYIRALAFGEDNDTLHNLKVVIFLKQKHKSKLGVTNPSSPEVATSSNKNVQSNLSPKKQNRVGGSGGDGTKSSKNSTTEVSKSTPSKSQRTFSSKAYDLINRGYIQEVKPW